ncbi:MAG: hypothetical protein MO852_04110 [Candidatus Devosia euplotis]|nr:hypothetical protein [Candidatus Devosia euplotis]
MIFYRADCADMALSADDIDENLIASARAIVVTGTHFSRPNSEAAQKRPFGRPRPMVRASPLTSIIAPIFVVRPGMMPALSAMSPPISSRRNTSRC